MMLNYVSNMTYMFLFYTTFYDSSWQRLQILTGPMHTHKEQKWAWGTAQLQ